ncbi:MAG: signal peptide peptidase SppA [Burkholderiaceae bacterium]
MAAAQPGFFRRWFGRLWGWLDTTRRVIVNLLLLAVIAAVLFSLFSSGAPKLQDKTALVLNLEGPLVEQESGSLRNRALNQIQGQDDAQTRLRDVIAVLDAAAKDPKIERAVLVLDDFAGAGLPALREVVTALERFKASGKQVVAWGSSYDQRQYFLAAHANEVLLHPMGMVYVEGLGRYKTYYKDAFDKLGVSANVIRVGKYKNFGEPYFATGPSPETLESEKFLLNDIWASYTGTVEKVRKLPAGSINKTIEELPQRLAAVNGDLAKFALEQKWIDGLKTRDELRAMMIERGAKSKDGKTFAQVSFDDYLAGVKPQTGGEAVGVVVAQGEIVDGRAPAGVVGGESVAELVRKAREDKSIKAVVLRVNSPGGSAFASELIRRELELTRAAGKPVVVSMGDVAASGGYWISMAADEVWADPATVTGSIGVFGMLPTAEKALEKVGVNSAGFGTTWLAGAYDPRRPLDPRFAQVVQTAISHIYTDFTTRAATARKTTPDKIDALAQGRVWTGAQAKERGLLDKTGGFGDAIAAAAQLAKLDVKEARVQYIEQEPGRLERLLAQFGGAVASVVGAQLSEQLAQAGLPMGAAKEVGKELGFLAQLANPALSGSKPLQAFTHCLCTAP